MLSNLLQNFLNFVASVPINLVILSIVCLILKIICKPFRIIMRVVTCYGIICFILSMLGLSLPSVPEILLWLKNAAIDIAHWFSAQGITLFK